MQRYKFIFTFTCKFYPGGGLKCCGVVKKDGSDQFGLAVTHAR